MTPAPRPMRIGSCTFATAWWTARNTCEAAMLSLHRTLSLRYLRRRWSRATLIVISIALGVAILVATQMLKQSMVDAGLTAANPLAGTYDLEVSNSDFGVPSELADRLKAARIPG